MKPKWDKKWKAKEVRAKALSEWRGYAEPRSIETNLRPAGDLVRVVMQKMNLSDQMDEEEVKGAWAEVAGPFLAQQSFPDSLRAGILKVRVIQPTVKFTLERELKPQLLQRLQQKLGAQVVRDLKFFIG
ncbi:DciA family protein [Sulfuriroseicoccus oceanibius]|uniref:DUF721 domain-containing protein n=1 Tax=Sulfuriroseicoccus oceanibius TaxID=2707525 RepID=A0A6B3L912_9BACT|nr:DciA family protein [Sulfuriroseicoccus oceanibius]QQL44401.1 DUF721 domain-containing protein [Sulfuriroseicoccus oceanibius]